MKFPAKYSQLPNYDYEYYSIINEINYEINKNDFENIVSNIKNSKMKYKYKHRTSLENLGLIKTKNNIVNLSDVGKSIREKEISMEEGLRILILQNNELMYAFTSLKLIGCFETNFSKKELVKKLHEKIYRETSISTIDRYIVPIINLFNISNFLEYFKKSECHKNIKCIEKTLKNMLLMLEKVYLIIGGEYGKVIALEKIEENLKNKYGLKKQEILYIWENIFDNIDLRYKYNLLTLPSWGTKYKGVKLRGQLFTHIIINK